MAHKKKQLETANRVLQARLKEAEKSLTKIWRTHYSDGSTMLDEAESYLFKWNVIPIDERPI